MTADELWALIIHLPRESPLMAAIAQDPFFAGDAVPRPLSLEHFSPEVEALAAVHDQLAALRATVVAVAGGKPKREEPYPRPVTASQRLRHERELDDWNDWARKLTGG